MQRRFVNVQINYYTNASTSCEILVKIGPVTSDFKRSKKWKSAATRLQFDDHRSFGTLAFRNGLEYQNCDFSRL